MSVGFLFAGGNLSNNSLVTISHFLGLQKTGYLLHDLGEELVSGWGCAEGLND